MGKDSQGWLSPYIEVVKETSKNLATTCGVSQGWLSPYIEVVKETSKNLETTCGDSQGWLSPYIEIVKATSKNLATTCGDSSVMAVAIHRSSESNEQEPRNHLRCFLGHGCRHT